MSESGDFDPGPWKGHDFKSAYRHYDAHAGRSYHDAVAKGKDKSDLLEKSIKTSCTNPLIIITDVTGSMGEWPKWIFSKLPYLEIEGKEYLGKDLEIAFGAFGDAYSDNYPLQMRRFGSGTDLKTRLEELVIEGNGGGTMHESSELAALYCAHKVSMPKAIKPIVVLITDEKPYDFISPDDAKTVAGVTLEKRMSCKEVFDLLKQRFAVYLVRKPYHLDSGNAMSADDQAIRTRWVNLLGEDHVCDLPDAQRVVDVIFGILAKETGRIDYFKEEIEDRQKPDQVKTVYKSLATIHKLPKSAASSNPGASILKLPEGDKGKSAKRLL